MKGWKKIKQPNVPPKQAGVAILTSDKLDFKFTLIKQDKEGHLILIKGEIHLNNNYQLICTQSQCTQLHQTYSKGLISTYRLQHSGSGRFNNPLSQTHRSSKQKINKEILELNHTIDQMDLVDVYRIFHPTSAQYTFFSVYHGTSSKTDHILGHNQASTNIRNKNNSLHSI
jgi:hypothetical protein